MHVIMYGNSVTGRVGLDVRVHLQSVRAEGHGDPFQFQVPFARVQISGELSRPVPARDQNATERVPHCRVRTGSFNDLQDVIRT